MRRYGLYPDLPSSADWVTLGGPEQANPTDWVYLGNLSEFGPKTRVRFSVGDEKVIAIFGKRGQGKSFTLGCLLEGLTLGTPDPGLAEIQTPRAVLLLDPLNIFQWIDIALTDDVASVSSELGEQVHRAKEWGLDGRPLRAQIFYPAGYAANVFRRGATQFRLGVSGFGLDEWASLLEFDMVKDIRGQLATEIWDKVTTAGWTGTRGEEVPPNANPTIDDYQQCLLNDADIQSGVYTQETLRALGQRLRAIASHEVFQGQGTDLTVLLRPGSVSVLLLNALPSDLRNVVASVLTRRIIASRAEASGARKDLLLNPSLTDAEKAER